MDILVAVMDIPDLAAAAAGVNIVRAAAGYMLPLSEVVGTVPVVNTAAAEGTAPPVVSIVVEEDIVPAGDTPLATAAMAAAAAATGYC